MARMNWGRIAKEGQMRRWGAEPIGGSDQTLSVGRPTPAIQAPSKGKPSSTKKQTSKAVRKALGKHRAKLSRSRNAQEAALPLAPAAGPTRASPKP